MFCIMYITYVGTTMYEHDCRRRVVGIALPLFVCGYHPICLIAQAQLLVSELLTCCQMGPNGLLMMS